MIYGKAKEGEVWHMCVKGKALCSFRFVMAETRSRQDVADADICQNCDLRLRMKGKQIRRDMKENQPAKKDEYTPRFKFKDLA